MRFSPLQQANAYLLAMSSALTSQRPMKFSLPAKLTIALIRTFKLTQLQLAKHLKKKVQGWHDARL